MSCARIIIQFFLFYDFARANTKVGIGARFNFAPTLQTTAVAIRVIVLSLEVSNNVQPAVKRTDFGER